MLVYEIFEKGALGMQKMKKKLLVSSTAVISFLSSRPVLAEGDDPFGTVENSLTDATTSFTTLGFVIAVIMLVVAGIALMLSRSAREWAKGHIGYVIVGIVVIVLASQVVAYIQSLFGG